MLSDEKKLDLLLGMFMTRYAVGVARQGVVDNMGDINVRTSLAMAFHDFKVVEAQIEKYKEPIFKKEAEK